MNDTESLSGSDRRTGIAFGLSTASMPVTGQMKILYLWLEAIFHGILAPVLRFVVMFVFLFPEVGCAVDVFVPWV